MGVLKDAGFEDDSVVTWTERRVEYQYGPNGTRAYTGVYSGVYTWEELEDFIREERWGSPYEITKKQERTVTMTDWKDAD